MKKLLYMVVVALTLSSCNSWFDVAIKEEYIDEDVLFCSESAFRNALNGIYTELRSSELFGSNLGLGGIEFMGQTLVPDSELKPIAEFDYNSSIMRGKVEQVWAAMYHAIYSCNNLIRLFNKNQDVVFVKGAREVMLAELKVLRVAMHYDLVRLFHPAYTSDPSFKGVYWKESTDNKLQQLSTQELYTKMLAQLTEAITILKKYDPIYTGESLNSDGLFGMAPSNRVWKMNYYATLGLKARILLSLETENGYLDARACVDEILEGGYFSFATSAGTDLAFSREHLLGLPSPKEGLQALGYSLFREKGIVLSPVVKVEEWKLEAPDDIRFRSINNTLQNLLPKYDSLSIAVFSGASQQIPYIKLGEIYLIGAEAALKLNDIAGAYYYLRTFADKRFSKTSVMETSTTMEFMEEIEKQYVREFLGEGQLFYSFKRWNLSSITSYDGRSIEMTKAKYVWPIPEN